MHLQLCFSLSFCLQLVFLGGFSTSIAWLDESFESSSTTVTLQYSTLVVQPKKKAWILKNKHWPMVPGMEPNGHPWIKRVVYNWMRVPKSFTMEKWLEITPHFPSFKKLVVWGFLVVFYAMPKKNPSEFFDEVAGLMQDMKTDLQRLQGRCLDSSNPGPGVTPWKINGWNLRMGGLVQMIFLFNDVIF